MSEKVETIIPAWFGDDVLASGVVDEICWTERVEVRKITKKMYGSEWWFMNTVN